MHLILHQAVEVAFTDGRGDLVGSVNGAGRPWRSDDWLSPCEL